MIKNRQIQVIANDWSAYEAYARNGWSDCIQFEGINFCLGTIHATSRTAPLEGIVGNWKILCSGFLKGNLIGP
ncbi:unnamed protein product, partial [Vitis vinifera]